MEDLKSDTPQTRIAAADALGKLGAAAKDAVPALLEAGTTDQAWIDTSMYAAIQQIGPAAVPALLDQLENGKPVVRGRAATALWIVDADRDQVLPFAKKFSTDKDPRVRGMIERIISKYSATDGAPTVPRAALPTTKGVPPHNLPTQAGDWAEFHGPRRDSLCAETGLLKAWPTGGPRLLWKLEGVGRGMSTVSIAQGKIFITGDRKGEGQYLICLDLNNREELWATRLGAPYKDFGALCTPTVEGAVLYTTTTEGEVCCLDTATGAVRWQKSMTKDFGGKTMNAWKFSESPLIDGERLICTPGAKDVALVALNKTTGAVIWKCAVPDLGKEGKDGAGYSSVTVHELAGVRQYVQVLGRGVIGVAAESGKFLWGYNRLASGVANITHPLSRGDYVFVSNSYGTGSSLLKIGRVGDGFQAAEAYCLPAKQFENHHGGIVMVGDHVYGGSGLNKGDPTCINFFTGEIVWKTPALSAGSAAVLYADGHLIFRYDRGLVVLAEATPKGFNVCGKFTPALADGPAWAHPVIFEKKLYLRHNDLLQCFDLTATGP
ncbi:MAG: PQQ-binding-like beta-propeller repeat protein [Kiritimatiellaeota bacterium]|nr:PQQ-binding-like beta-propeller repeat protein [Kiritimatiellota bacterium]